MRNYVAQAVAVVLNGTLGRTCESAPTVSINLVARGGWDCADATRKYSVSGLRNYVARGGWVCAGQYRRADI